MDGNQTIDFVIMWVDMKDPAWKESFEKYSHKSNNIKNAVTDARFRDYGLLRYWFRGVEKFAPWVNKIHFVSNGQVPSWLNITHPKIHLVPHKDIIPQQYLPVFNSGVIERYFHKIEGLSENFVFFNDDFYIIRPIEKERFFKNGLPQDIAVFQYSPSWAPYYIRIKNNIRIINDRFDKRKVIKENYDKWFSPEYGSKVWMNKLLKPMKRFITLKIPHNAQPYLKSTFEEVWNFAGDELYATSTNRFRALTDYTHELFRTWQICSGNFNPYNTYKDTKMFPLLLKSKKAVKAIEKQSYSLICINDNEHIKNYDEVMGNIEKAFKSILPQQSSYELTL